MSFDLVIRGGAVVTQGALSRCDVGISNGTIAAIAQDLASGREEIDATGMLVLPGGVEAHCHIEQVSSFGLMGADDFYSGSVAAAHGGNTTIVPFAAQHRGQRLPDVLADYHERARTKSVLDYSFHMIITDPTERLLSVDLPEAIRSGLRSLKVFMAYDLMAVSDEQFLDLLSVCRENGALAMVHAENNGMIKWMSKRLIDNGCVAPRYQALSHPRLAEIEAVNRAISLATLTNAPLVIVHVSCAETIDIVRRARAAGLEIWAETCPQYLFLKSTDSDLPGYEGAKLCFSPPPRSENDQLELWRGLRDSTLELYSSDHAPYRMDETGKFARSATPTFKEIANGLPGIEVRLPLLFSEGYRTGRIDLKQFVELSATNPAKIYGLYPRKGCIAVSSDADIALWDPDRKVTIRASDLHDRVGYSPYEGRVVTGWPSKVLVRGKIVVDSGKTVARAGSGLFLPRDATTRSPLAPRAPETDPAHNYGARIFTDL